MTHETIKQAIGESDAVARARSGETVIPPPNYDIVICIYERDADGTDADQPFVSVVRPQDFATNPHMKYQRFAVVTTHEGEGTEYLMQWLVHLYWDGSRDADNARDIVLANADKGGILSYGIWRPAAPSDPLVMDDFWDEDLGDPPNGFWDGGEETEPLFDNFARPPYEKVG